MTHFLDRTASFLVQTFGADLPDIVVVLPNRRAGLFLRRFMAAHAGKACWSPLIFSVEDFIAEIGGLHEAEPLALLFELYAVHKEVEGGQAQPFEEFLHWAPQLLSDFNEIDRYLVDPEQLFSYLDEARVLSLWNLENQPLTDFETNYLRFYHSLGTYYKLLSQRMLASRRAWQGLLFRHAASTIPGVVHTLPWKQVVFAGFNALTRAEEAIISELRLNKKATLLWDADEYYLNNEIQEAGSFLREWIRKWPSAEIRWVGDDLASGEKDIRIIGAPDPVGQVKFCGNLLQELALQGKANESTAVVLLDPSLLNPLLNSMPEEVKEMNITAGLPLKQTPLADLFELVFRLHLNTKQFSYLRSIQSKKFYYKDVLRVLRHPMVQEMATSLAGDNRFAFEQVIERIRKGSRIFLSYEDLVTETAGLFGPGLGFLDALFTGWETPQEALAAFRAVIESLRLGLMDGQQEPPGVQDPEIRLELEYLFSFTKIFHQLSTILEETGTAVSLQTFFQIFRQTMDSTNLPFSGEPLRGLQVMGMLETRTLDFENVILLSCNEDLLPSGKVTPSFIPFDIKRDFGLPTYRHKDAVYAYHFYRLLQRAKNVWILYSTEANELGGGDKSRFIRQIEQELTAGHPNVKITSTLLAPPPVSGLLPPEIKVEKRGEVWKQLEKKAEDGFSATSINAFRNCSLKFYLQEIAGIREVEELAETIDPMILGQAIHEALAILYLPYKDKALTAEIFPLMQKQADEAVMKGFAKKYKGSDVNFGKNLLLVNVARMMVKRFLRFEKEAVEELAVAKKEMKLLWIEERVAGSVTIRADGRELKVSLKGFIDRVDRYGGALRIIDYKSGTANKKNLEVGEWEDLHENPDLDMAFQLLMYGYLLKSRFKNSFEATAGVIPLRKLNAGMLTAKVPETEGAGNMITERSLDRFEKIVVQILEAVFDPAKPFTQTDNTELCKKCPYINLCRR
jgi:ATP-dependent helicase/nuclease subunit B